MHVGYNNLTISATTIGARTESTSYPVSGLQAHTLFPGYRSADRCLILNGTNEYAYVADAAGISITGDMTIEVMIKPGSVTGTQHLLNKSASSANGWVLLMSGDELVMYIRGATEGTSITNAANLAIGTWYRVKVVYDASAQEVTWWINGASAAATAGGTIPNAMVDNATRLTVGADSAAGNPFNGSIAYIGIDSAEFDNGGWLQASACNAYWDFDDDDLTDGVGGFTLTGSGIDATNYGNCTAYHWIDLVTASDDPAYLFIPRQHNLSTGATVKFYRGDKFGGSPSQVGDTFTVTAGAPIVIRDTTPPAAVTTHYAEIHDPSNVDGYLYIPYLYIGDVTALTGDLADWSITPRREAIQNANPLGNVRTYSISKTHYIIDGNIIPVTGNLSSSADDFTYLLAIADTASEGVPVVWCIDNATTTRENKMTFLVYIMNGADMTLNALTAATAAANNDETWQVPIALQELAVEA